MPSTKKGFTLIELLVVISIISLLSSIVMASVTSARKKAVDAAIKQNLTQMRVQGELYFQANSSFGGFDAANSPGRVIYNAALAAVGGVDNTDGGFYADASTNSWVALVVLKTSPALAWCVDYSGVSRSIAMPPPPIVHIPPLDCATIGSA